MIDFFKSLIDVSTFPGTVAATLLAAFLIWLIVLAKNAIARAGVMDAHYSPESFSLQEAIDSRFDTGGVDYRTAMVGKRRVVLGFTFNQDVGIISFDVRPMERRGLLNRWKDLKSPYVVHVTAMTMQQLDWRRQSTLSYGCWPDGESAGMICYIQPGVPPLPRANAIWVEVEVEALQPWTGSLSVRAKIGNTTLLRRLAFSVVAPSH